MDAASLIPDSLYTTHITFFKRGQQTLLNSAKEHPTTSKIHCHVGFS
jgi:hypothetical protein